MASTDLRLISMRLREDLLRRVDALAAAQHLTRSAVIEQLLLKSIEEDEIGIQVLTDPIVGRALLGAIAKPEVLRAMTGVIRSELTDEQLHLFTRAMASLDSHLAKRPAPLPGTPATPRRGRKGKR